MASYNKNTKSAPVATKPVQNEVKEEVIQEIVQEVVSTDEFIPIPEVVQKPTPVAAPAPRKTRPVIDLKTMVEVRNISDGSLTYVSRKSGTEVIWNEFGDREWMDVAELQTMKTSQPRFFNEPWVMIDDEEVIDFLGLRSLYSRIVADNEVDSFFNKPIQEMIEKLQKAPTGTRELIASKARSKVENESLYDSRIIRALEKELNIDLSMVS